MRLRVSWFFFPAMSILAGVLIVPSIRGEEIDHSQCSWESCASKHRAWSLRSRMLPRPVNDERPPGNGRQYAPDRLIDVLHQKIEFTPDFAARSLKGISTITFAPIARPLEELKLDGMELGIGEVTSTAPIASQDYDDRQLTLVFKEPVPAGKEVTVSVSYTAEPRHGLYFRTAAMGYPEGDDHLWTQGEPQLHRYWFPGYDYPNERFTSEVICHVPENMTVLSNGDLVSGTVSEGVRTVHWHQKQEHVNYLISVVAGHLKGLDGKQGDLPLAFYTPPSEFAEAESSFRDTAKIISFLEKEIGVSFPWVKYFNVCVSDFIAGGMENTSITTLTTGTLFTESSENLRSSHRLDAHEATHQWFGDLLTCKDWSHLWLNEGFATFYTHLYEEEKNGRDSMLYGLRSDMNQIVRGKDEKPIVWREYVDPMEQFDYRAYPKGSWVLHMLRCQLGPDLYRECIRTYVERNRNKNVVTSDLARVIEEKSGRSFDEFFDQWVYHGGNPLLKVSYRWDPKASKAFLSVEQTQKVSDKVLLFDFPLTFRFVGEKGAETEKTVRFLEKREDFSFDLEEKPAIVRVDPGMEVLAGIKFTPPADMLFNQLKQEGDAIGRVIAAETLGGRRDKKSLEALGEALSKDPFYGVRIEAAQALVKSHTPEALDILIKNREQEDARVRAEVVVGIGKFFHDKSLEVLQQVIASEENPDIVSRAIGSIGKYPADKVEPVLMTALQRDSYRHRIAMSAAMSMRAQGDPVYVDSLLAFIEKANSALPAYSLGDALDAVAYLARDLEGDAKRKVREVLLGYLNHPKEMIRPEAMRALATLEDPDAIPVLESFVGTGGFNDPDSRAAEEAIKKLGASRKQSDEVKALREKVTELSREVERISGQMGKGQPPGPEKEEKPAEGEKEKAKK